MAMKAWMKTGKLDLKRKHSESETETSKQKKTKQISESHSPSIAFWGTPPKTKRMQTTVRTS